ncbi:MAG: hypothetical protein ACP5R4_14775 [Armatimonadota bacterium]
MPTASNSKPHIVHISNHTGIGGAGMSVLRPIRNPVVSEDKDWGW